MRDHEIRQLITEENAARRDRALTAARRRAARLSTVPANETVGHDLNDDDIPPSIYGTDVQWSDLHHMTAQYAEES